MFIFYHCLIREVLYLPPDPKNDRGPSPEDLMVLKQIGGYLYYAFVVENDKKLPDLPDNAEVIKLQERVIEPADLDDLVYSTQYFIIYRVDASRLGR